MRFFILEGKTLIIKLGKVIELGKMENTLEPKETHKHFRTLEISFLSIVIILSTGN